MENKKYYIGLDIGTDSVGYAASYEDYSLCKFRGEPMWGTHLFDAAEQSSQRRAFRTARRRLDRRQQRVLLLQEIFAAEIGRIDPRFFVRIQESALFQEDKSDITDRYSLFHDPDYTDINYHKAFPTIHHLIHELMISDQPHDPRLVYLACAWLVAHRGHFLSELNMENIRELDSFDSTYQEFTDYYAERDILLPWDCDAEAFSKTLLLQTGITEKKKSFFRLLNGGKSFKDTEDGLHRFDRTALITLLSGGTVAPKALFFNTDYADIESITLGKDEEKLEMVLSSLQEDDAEFIRILQRMSDWAALSEIRGDYSSISEAKIAVYNRHKTDLTKLKAFVKKYLPQKYKEIFNQSSEKLNNYAAYSYHYKTLATGKQDPPKKKATKEEFCKYLKAQLKGIKPKKADQAFYEDMLARLDTATFLPKQVDGDNRVIPHQLYLYELQEVVARASTYLPWLSVPDEDGLTPAQKILSIFSFRIPYYVGPLRKDGNEHAWIERKAGRILPWNFTEMVDLDKSEEAFIKKMTNRCSYLPEKGVLPRYSLLYCRFTVLNEINNLQINGNPITPAQKQDLYTNCILASKSPRISRKKIENYFISNGVMTSGDVLSGVDEVLTSTLKPYYDFRRLLESHTLTEEQVESIILRSAYMEDTVRFTTWIRHNFPHLEEADVRYVTKKRYKEFGRLSEEFLNGLVGKNNDTNEHGTILHFLWHTNYNLMQLLSERFTFADEIKDYQAAYYTGRHFTLDQRLDDMYISNAVKRPIIRALTIVKEVVQARGYTPERIFVEMARGAEEKKRTKTRKTQLLELYHSIPEDTAALEQAIEDMGEMADNNLQSDKLFLYYLQLGKCMYTGESISLSSLMTKNYDIDHIYPQSRVKDDSLLNNRVLVLSTVNGEKGDKYPIDLAIQANMASFWAMFHNNGLITDEKYRRLTRKTEFTNEEKMGFINRQLVETRQSTKVVTQLLKERYPGTEIVFVKAGLVADFRHLYKLVKCRSVDDLHHARDAYLNIVAGNVYHCRFTKHFRLDREYSLNPEAIFTHPVYSGKEKVWNPPVSIDVVKKTYAKHHIHLTKYAFCRKGGFFDQMPLKAAEGLIPRKRGLDTAKYGGYTKPSASFFLPVRYLNKKNLPELSIIPVELLHADKVFQNEEQAVLYVKETLFSITGNPTADITFPLGLRPLKINTVFSLDGLRLTLSGKSGGGRQLLFSLLKTPTMPQVLVSYVKKLESYTEKKKSNSNIQLSEKHDEITPDANLALYRSLTEKAHSPLFARLPGSQKELLLSSEDKFMALSLHDQVSILLQMVLLYKTNRSGSCDLSLLGGSPNSGSVLLSFSLSNWKKNYSDVRVIDSSPAGLHETVSQNLLELL